LTRLDFIQLQIKQSARSSSVQFSKIKMPQKNVASAHYGQNIYLLLISDTVKFFCQKAKHLWGMFLQATRRETILSDSGSQRVFLAKICRRR